MEKKTFMGFNLIETDAAGNDIVVVSDPVILQKHLDRKIVTELKFKDVVKITNFTA